VDTNILKTKIIKSGLTNKTLISLRQLRINEAISWSGGTFLSPHKHVITKLDNGFEVYFLKPGKETKRANPNPHDMTPKVGNSDNHTFQDIWTYLSRAAFKDWDLFKILLVIIYRSIYFKDHIIKNDKVRYNPSSKLLEIISHIDNSFHELFPFDTISLLHYLDIIGWNEDVKYHSNEHSAIFSSKHNYPVNAGRINTMLSFIRVPYQTCHFIEYAIEQSKERKQIETEIMFDIMQNFARTRGICPATNAQLKEWLYPYIL